MTADSCQPIRQPDYALPIEDYALIGDCRSGALVGKDGSIDWLCWPRFDSDACLSALLGTSRQGHWRIGPANAARSVHRRYRDDTLLLETEFELDSGTVRILDYMPIGVSHSSVVRIVEGRQGLVPMQLRLLLLFDFGSATPWLTEHADGHGVTAVAGVNCVVLRADAALEVREGNIQSAFGIAAGERLRFTLTWGPSHLDPPPPPDVEATLRDTQAFWQDWAARCQYHGEWRNLVVRSLLTLKALTYQPTGGIVAALTTSLPEYPGGTRNWDYRYCWLRDATMTLNVLMRCGYYDEAAAWSAWVQRAVAGDPEELQIMYGIAGERRLLEWTPQWLIGYQGAAPVRIGNAASGQLQIDVYGEIIGSMYSARAHLPVTQSSWPMVIRFMVCLEKVWQQPDESIWEVRGGRKQFTYSKIMAWVAFDRAIRAATEDADFDFPEVLEHWKELRTQIHEYTCAHCFNKTLNIFTQSPDTDEVDASLLSIPLSGFLPIDDPRVQGTIAAIERELMLDGLVVRYRTDRIDDGMPSGEGTFLACSFWLAEVWSKQGRLAEARTLFTRLAALCNDVGLLSEEYAPKLGRQLGNFPQALSHLALISTALALEEKVTD